MILYSVSIVLCLVGWITLHVLDLKQIRLYKKLWEERGDHLKELNAELMEKDELYRTQKAATDAAKYRERQQREFIDSIREMFE